MIYVALVAALTCIGGFLSVPLFPVPFTLQTLFVYLGGSLLGSKRGAISQILFLFIGLSGVPVFTMGGGPGYILQPTFGYLAGFPVGAFVLGAWVERTKMSNGVLKLYFAHLLALVVVFSIGVAYLYLNVNYILGKEMNMVYSVSSGFLVFIPGELVKIIISVGITSKYKTWF
jgi:biotin transport system substrate-specific component